MPPGYGPNQLKGRPRRRVCEQVRARHAPCAMCGYPINQALPRHPRPHKLSSVVDEWIPRVLGGDPLDPANLVELHHLCNAIKGARLVTPDLQARCRRRVEALLAGRQPSTRRRW
jgi:hypothetical protein